MADWQTLCGPQGDVDDYQHFTHCIVFIIQEGHQVEEKDAQSGLKICFLHFDYFIAMRYGGCKMSKVKFTRLKRRKIILFILFPQQIIN